MLTIAAGSENRLLVMLMAVTAVLSAFVSNTGTVATLLPAVVAAAIGLGRAPSRLLIPLAFSANVGGLLALTGTPPNIVAATVLDDEGLRVFGFFEFAYIGAPLLVTTILYMRFVGQRLLPDRQTEAANGDANASIGSLDRTYGLLNDVFRIEVPRAVALDGATIEASRFGPASGVAVLAMDRPGRTDMPAIPRPEHVIRGGDTLMVKGRPEAVAALLEAGGVRGDCSPVPDAVAHGLLTRPNVMLAEALGVALEVTGGAELVADGLVESLGRVDPLLLLAGVFVLTTGLSQVINNTATTVLMAPIVLAAAESLEVSPHPFLMTVVVSASTAFLTPIGTTTNLMVFEPGGYRFSDYVNLGLPLMLLFLVITVALVPVIWPF